MNERTQEHVRTRTDQLSDRDAGRLVVAFLASVMLVLAMGILL
jgi:hypothetical protein